MSAGLKTFSLTEYEANIGGEGLNEFLDSFSCPINPEVEHFLKHKAVLSAKLSSSQTYLVCSDTTGELLGYYTLVLKSYSVNGAKLSSANRRLVSRFAEADDAGNFNAAVYLIAQIGKNFAVAEKDRVAGGDLIANAPDEFRAIKKRVGGKLVMIERESDRPKLLAFYTKNGFKSWTSRFNAKDGVTYDQMFTVLNDKKETA